MATAGAYHSIAIYILIKILRESELHRDSATLEILFHRKNTSLIMSGAYKGVKLGKLKLKGQKKK